MTDASKNNPGIRIATQRKSLIQGLQQELAALDQKHLLRQRRTVETPSAPNLKVDGRDLLAFCSNDYLGLAAHPKLAEAMQEGTALYGVGSGASGV